MTPKKHSNPDAITLAEPAVLRGITEVRVTRLRREGFLRKLDGTPSYSRADVEEFILNPWINGRQAAMLLGVSHVRVSQLANEEKIPFHVTSSGLRVYRQRQIEVVANARNRRFHSSPR